MDNLESVSNAGLNSLSGFSYQIKVFIYRLTMLMPGQQVEFETLDDVAVRSLPNADMVSDSCLKWSVNNNLAVEVFQVKQTNVTANVGRQVLYNWLLAYNQRPEITKFILYIAGGYNFSEVAFTNDPKVEYKNIIGSDQSENALVSRVKKIYTGNFEKFEKDYKLICRKYKIEYLYNIDKLIEKQLITTFHATGTDIYFEKRIRELFTKVCARIMDYASSRSAYVCTQVEYMELCEEICNSISSTQYLPDYESFCQVFAQRDLTEKVKSSREYRQLCYCNLPSAEILEHLRWEQYYQNIRQHLLSDAKKDAISKTEKIAHQNHADVVYELKEDEKDSPRRRLTQTRCRPISTLHDEFSRWGTYIFLTADNVANQISWKDDEDEELYEQPN